ncbi:PREDICTED: RNA-directed DNA polymerase from mobile element jockey-like [Papilio polytes]|uniref:RNA-directed DNA polymerase from mobile element jockey-like n=1 Tax=Papilio polytes TaxID=76194 RepID=UPI0006766371|nr:PREDICTED: RNA-directed DNA polymerase from mobile element jockey-like [Papilio polytes]
MDRIVSCHDNKDFPNFWRKTNALNVKTGLPVSVDGVSEPASIANLFKNKFVIKSPLVLVDDRPEVQTSEHYHIRFTAKEVAETIRQMKRGKSPGHDSLSIEHLQHAGSHLPRVLSMFINFCIAHSYLPDALMKTIVVPIIKNNSGDASDANNYRPISLATVVAKVFDSMLDKQLSKHLSIHDAQFGFRAGLSTEAAILCVKHTVKYYTDRKTPVYACFLDLSKAFDLVSYGVLWKKLYEDTTMPDELIELFKYWYTHQDNAVRWAGSLSDSYRLECGVRQGGLTSPKLFSLYVNRLIGALSGSMVGCSIDGTFINNINYADDMVLLAPSISALRKLLHICENFAIAHGLKYNALKSELLVFPAGNKCYLNIPPVTLSGTRIKTVTKYKYLGHWLTATQTDDNDIERERRALAVRSNMIIRRFAACSKGVKLILFRAYCQSFYTCSLWCQFSQRAYSALRVQYNNAFRALLGLPRYCSASGMFAEARVDGFAAIRRKRIASLMARVRGSRNTILEVVGSRMDSPVYKHWVNVHVH